MDNIIKLNSTLLDDAYKNVRMGTYAIDCILPKITDQELINLVKKQNEYYLQYTKQLENFAKKINYQTKDVNAMLKTSSFLSIKMKTLIDKTNSHIAQMLIEGTTMGITTLIKEVNEHQSASPELISLSKNIISHQEKFVEELKKFL